MLEKIAKNSKVELLLFKKASAKKFLLASVD